MCKNKRILLIVCLSVGIPLMLIAGCFAALFPESANFVFGSHFNHSITDEIKVARELNRLAEFPKTATDIKGSDWNTLFSGDTYIRFTAPQKDIADFIQDSPGLTDVQPEPMSEDNMLYYCTEELAWFLPGVDTTVVYAVKDSLGYVAVDNKDNTVYILAIIS